MTTEKHEAKQCAMSPAERFLCESSTPALRHSTRAAVKCNAARLILLATAFFFVLFGGALTECRAREIQLQPDSDIEAITGTVQAGDTLVLRNGQWRDVDLKFERLRGTAEAPILIRSESPGGGVFTGSSSLRVSGDYVIVSGFVFRNIVGVSDVFQLRSHSERLAHHCRVTECVFQQDADTSPGKECRWLSVYGSHNRVDHCRLVGKKTVGTTLVVWITNEPGLHRIDHNHFGHRPELGRGKRDDEQYPEFGCVELKLRRENNLLRPADSDVLRTHTKSRTDTDIDGGQRHDRSLAGCDDPDTDRRPFASATNTGPGARNEATLSRQFVTGSRLILGTQLNRSASVRAADFDGDGDLDLVVANGRHWPQQNYLFLNQGRARFNVARPIGSDLSTSYACEPADFDGDGDIDIAVGNDMAPCRLMLNDGSGRFTEGAEFGTPSSVRSLTACDIDNDGDIDLLVTCRGRANRIHLNDGRGVFPEATTFGSKDDSTISVAAADVNSDGHVDLILANRDAQPNTLLLGIGGGNFRDSIQFGEQATDSRAVVIADIDEDGNLDWIIANLGQPNTVCFGDGSGGVRTEVNFGDEDGQTYCLAIADMDGDSRLDIVAGNVGSRGAVYLSREGGQRFEKLEFGEPQGATYGICTGDFDGDGFTDIAVANSDGFNRVFLNRVEYHRDIK